MSLVSKLLEEAGIDPSKEAPIGEWICRNLPLNTEYRYRMQLFISAESEGRAAGGGMNSGDWVRVSKQGKIFKIELNRPDKFNAITWEMYEGEPSFEFDLIYL
jgi:hypothetical protein